MGTFYTVTTHGVIDTLVYFGGTNGAQPCSNMVLGGDGSLYGATEYTIFKATTDGAITTLATLTPAIGIPSVYCGLVEASPGSFYGTTSTGGPMNFGAIFKVTSTAEHTRETTGNSTAAQAIESSVQPYTLASFTPLLQTASSPPSRP